MLEEVQQDWELENPPVFSYRTKATWLHGMWKAFQKDKRPEKLQVGLVHTGEKPYICSHCGQIQSRREFKKTPKKKIHIGKDV